jgi:hypothetical protein
MSHVDGVDDGVGYGVYGKTIINVGVVGESNSGFGAKGTKPGITLASPQHDFLINITSFMIMNHNS